MRVVLVRLTQTRNECQTKGDMRKQSAALKLEKLLCMDGLQHIDYVVAADVLYEPECIEPFIGTVAFFCFFFFPRKFLSDQRALTYFFSRIHI